MKLMMKMINKLMFASNFDGRGDRLTNDCVNIKSLLGIKDNFLDDHDHGDHDYDFAADDAADDNAADEFLKRKGSQQC